MLEQFRGERLNVRVNQGYVHDWLLILETNQNLMAQHVNDSTRRINHLFQQMARNAAERYPYFCNTVGFICYDRQHTSLSS